MQLTGEISEGQQWSAAIGEGWVFRILPIAPSGHGYSGWDLAVEAPGSGGYPDALLLATPPYGSLNEREIGTTFGLRAQDAIAWEPRRFHFLASTRSLAQARALYPQVTAAEPSAPATSQLLRLITESSANRIGSGQIRILDARLISGAADPAPYARQWIAHLHQVPHTIVQPGPQSTPNPRGELQWMRFEATLWLPGDWQAPETASGSVSTPCVP